MTRMKSKTIKGNYQDLKGDIFIELFQNTNNYIVRYSGKGFFDTFKTFKETDDLSDAIKAYEELELLIKL